MKKKYDAVLLDMDGTIADTYNVPNWLDQLRSESVEPFINAQPLIPEEKLFSLFSEENIIICTMLPKGVALGTPYADACQQAKREWLERYFPSLQNAILFMEYGDNKSLGEFSKNCLLIDDSATIRDNFNGYTLNAASLQKGGY